MEYKKLLQKDIEKIYDLFLEKKTIKEIALAINFSTTSVRKYIKLKYPNADLHYSRRKYEINEDYFKIIDTEKKAYFLGLMYADGCVMTRKNIELSKIALVTEDDYILEEFKKDTNATYPFFYYKRSKLNSNWKDVTEFTIGNKNFTKNLINLGCGFKKSNHLKFPKEDILPLEFRSHFIRGYFDGDGSICINKNRKNKKVLRFEGTFEFLIELQKVFNQELNTTFTKIQKRHKDRPSNAYTLQYYGSISNNNCNVFYEYMYKNASVFLKRKHDKFKNI